MLRKIGWVKSIDFDGLRSYLCSFTAEERMKEFYFDVSQGGRSDDCVHAISKANFVGGKLLFPAHDELLCYQPQSYRGEDRSALYASFLTKKLSAISNAVRHNLDIGRMVEIVYETGLYVVVEYAVGRYVTLPKVFVQIRRAPDYSGVSLGSLSSYLTLDAPGGASYLSLMPVGQSATLSTTEAELRSATENLQSEIAKAEDEYKLAKQEMEKKLQELKAQQEKALSALRAKVEELKDCIFVFEMNIFALRSLFGETFSLVQLVGGKSSQAPLVLYQKFRFCDEEFALLGGRGFDGSHGSVSQLFTNRLVRERFCPSDKCISFFRVSKDGKKYAYDADVDGLAALEYYHGNQIGMLIRNGENVWLSFIDEEVTLSDNLFESASTHAVASKKLEGSHIDARRDAIVLGETKLRDPVVRSMLNRVQVFNVIKGVIENTNIFPELKGVDILRAPSNLVVFSSADNQLTTSKYPSFSDYFTTWRVPDIESMLRSGDPILVVSEAAATRFTSRGEAHRSRGYANRARDAEDIDSGMNRLSVIERKDEYYRLQVDKPPYKRAEDNNGVTVYYRSSVDKSEMGKPNVVCEPKFTYYVSAARHPYDWTRRDAWGNLPSRVNRVNLHIYRDEFCPMVYVNSNYVKSWLEQRNIGDWGGSNYTYLTNNCFYPALKFLQEREEKAVRLIQKFVPSFAGTSDELDSLLDWQKQFKVKVITEYQAKRFANWYKSLEVSV